VGYQALSGRRPFPQENLAELVRAISEGLRAPLAALRPDADPALVNVIERALARDFGSATEMRAALPGGLPVRPPTRVLESPPADPTTRVVPVRRQRRRRRPVIAAIGAIAVVVMVVVAFVVDSASRPSVPEPAGSTTSEPSPPTTSVVPPPSSAPVPTDQQGPPKDRGGGNGKGNTNGHKPKHGQGG
jgi:serine/threonine-protein kinase